MARRKKMPKPRGLSAWQKLRAGSAGRKQVPASVFLVPSRRTYPVKTWNTKTQRFEYSPRMLRAAISRANTQGDTGVQKRASAILRKLNKGEKRRKRAY